MVRNEADIIRPSVLYHLSLGLDQITVVDNGSTDGTDRELEQLRREDSRVRWSRDHGPFLPSRVMTALARQAFREGADWVVPFDADEFWHVPRGTLRERLGRSEAGVLVAEVVTFVQRRSVRESSPEALLYMTKRVASPVGPPGYGQGLVESHEIAFVEKMYAPKCLSRPTAEIVIETGNHKVYDAAGPKAMDTEAVCFHAPIRSRAALEERIRSAGRAAEAGRKPGQGRNRRRLAKLKGKSAVKREWAANSHRRGILDVYGQRHSVVPDSRLRDAVAPFISPSSWEKLNWPLIKSAVLRNV